MGACSSRPSVLDDENLRVPAPVPLVGEEATAAEAEVFEDTLEHDPEEAPIEESNAGEGSEAVKVIEAEATPLAEEPQTVVAPLAAEDSGKNESNQVDAPASDNIAEPVEGNEADKCLAESINAKNLIGDQTPAESVEANPSEEAAAPKDEGKQERSESPAAGGNPFQSFMSNVTKGWGWR